MARSDPTVENAGTAPDGRIYMDRARCRELLMNETKYRFFSSLAVFGVMLFLCLLSALAFYTASQTSDPLARGVWILAGVPPILYAVVTGVLVVRRATRFLRARKGVFSVETDEIAGRATRWKYSRIVNGVLLISRRPVCYTYVWFRKNGKIVLNGDAPIETVNTRDTVYVVRAGKSTRSRRVDLWFNTRKYVWKE